MDYSNQEFISKMNELLTMLKTMSSGYDPTVSSESDPIVVLLKEMGMSDDQIIYLIGKAVGELFPSRVQQRENAQELYDILGYSIRKYRSAVGDISLRLKNTTNLVGNNGVGIFVIPRFTRIGDANGQFEYVTTEKVQWTTTTAMTAQQVTVMEGRLKQLQIGGSTEIKLVNLDENYRVYFPEKNVAENGIFIAFGNNEEFVKKDNVFALSSQNIYYVGEDEDGEMYVQFPPSIVNLLGSGDALSIKYLVTDGTKGNCKINTLTTVLDEIIDPTTEESITAKIIVRQAEPMNNGSDPESLDSMYRNFKKVQNRLGTLVVEKDYEGAAFLAEFNRRPLWSNVVVASRLNDLNQTVQIKTLVDFRTKDYYRLIDRDDESETGLNVGTMFIYGLAESNQFDAQFIVDLTSPALANFQSQILEENAINQDIRYPQQAVSTTDENLQLGFLNTFFLSGMVMLKNTVNNKDAKEIKDKIMQRLEYVYAARQREFGKEIDYQEAVDTIIGSDGRIQTVALNIPRYQIKNMADTTTGIGPQPLSETRKTELIAKMILRGNIQLFKHDESFSLTFGQVATPPVENVVKISTAAGNKNSDTTDKLADGYAIKPNEVLQVKGNKYRTTVEYGALVNYKFVGNGDISIAETTTLSTDAILASGSVASIGSTLDLNITVGAVTEPLPAQMQLGIGSILKANSIVANGSTGVDAGTLATDTTLAAPATLAIGSQIATNSHLVLGADYTFSYGSGIKSGSVLEEGSLIKAGSNYEGEITGRKLKANADNLLISGDTLYVRYNDGGVVKTETYNSGKIVRPSFELSQTLETGEYPKTLAIGQSISIREKAESIIAKGTLVYFISNNPTLLVPANGTYEMGDKEYLIYTNAEKDELVIINPGTVIKNNTAAQINQSFDGFVADVSEIDSENIEWQGLQQAITVVDQEIFTFGEGITAQCDTPLDRDWTTLTAPITITDGQGNAEELENELSGSPYRARIILNLVANNEQKLFEGQSVEVTDDDEDTTTYEGSAEGINILFDAPTVALGGEYNIVEPRMVTSYTEQVIGGTVAGSNPTTIDGALYINKKVMEMQSTPGELTLPFKFNSACLVNISINTRAYGSLDVPMFSIETGAASLDIIGGGILGDDNHPMANVQADYQCLVPAGAEDIVVTSVNLNLQNYLRIGRIVALQTDTEGNPLLNTEEITLTAGGDYNDTVEDAYDAETNAQAIFDKVNVYGLGMYDYGYKVPEGKKVKQPTRSSSFWNPYHIGNKYTIAKLDLQKTKDGLTINPSQVL